MPGILKKNYTSFSLGVNIPYNYTNEMAKDFRNNGIDAEVGGYKV